MSKTEVYSWRLTREMKEALEAAARAERITLAQLLDRMAARWLQESERDEQKEQRRLHAAASKFIGSIGGGDPQRAAQARQRIRAKLRKQNPMS